MAIDTVFTFDTESYDTLKRKTLTDIDGANLKQELKGYQSSITDLSVGGQKESLDRRGFVIAVSGAWGTGKSTATWALINELDKITPDHFVIIDRSLLPFGSVNESISAFLSDFATTLKNENLIDISNEIGQFILESTPSTGKVGVTASLGPVSLSRDFEGVRESSNTDALVDKFRGLRRKSKTVIVVLDDLDRLRPSEVVDVLRMVEKLRMLPGVLVILPIFKKIINEAIRSDLSLGGPSAATFLRKLTDAEISIENDVKDLKASFDGTLKALLGDKDEKRMWGVGTLREVQLSDLVWSLLLHIMVISETISKAKDAENANPYLLFSDMNSNYLKKMADLFRDSSPNSNDQQPVGHPYPVWDNKRGEERLTSIGARWPGIRDKDGKWLNELEELLGWGNSASVVTTDGTVIDTLKAQRSIPFTKDGDGSMKSKEEASHVPIFIEVFMPLAQATQSELLLAENYKRRDINILARKIAHELAYMTLEPRDENAMRQLFGFVKSKYDQFRG